MAENILQQHCWNHAVRGAVCRCPACRRAFCRECVSEHDSRLLCATCIQASLPVENPANRRVARIWVPSLALASALLAWFLFFSLGQIIMESVTLADLSAWRER
jgi:hypothetical protein